MEPLFLSFASQLRVNVSSRPSSGLATVETLRPRRCPDALCDSLSQRDTLHGSFNPLCLPVPLTFHIFREDAQAASVGFLVRLSGLFGLSRLSGHQRDRTDRATTRETLHGSFKRMLKQPSCFLPLTFHVSRFTSSHCQLAAKTVCTSCGR